MIIARSRAQSLTRRPPVKKGGKLMLADIQKLTDVLAIDASGQITAEDRAAAIELALFRYSSDRPRIVSEIRQLDGSTVLTVPADWHEGFSRVLEISRQSGGRIAFEVRKTLSGEKIILTSFVKNGETAVISYTLPHILKQTEDTIAFVDREAVANWAAAFLLDGMAAGCAGSLSSTISSDSVEHSAKANNYHAQAVACRKFYRDHLGLDDKRNTAAGTTVVVKRLGTSGQPGIIRREALHG